MAERCEKCGSAQTVEILLQEQSKSNVAAIPAIQKNKIIPKYSLVAGIACTECGAIFRLKLVNPEKLKQFVGY